MMKYLAFLMLPILLLGCGEPQYVTLDSDIHRNINYKVKNNVCKDEFSTVFKKYFGKEDELRKQLRSGEIEDPALVPFVECSNAYYKKHSIQIVN